MRKLVLPVAICLIATGFGPAWSQGKPPPLGVEPAPAPAAPGGKPPPLGAAPPQGPAVAAVPGGKPPPLPPGSGPFGVAPGGRRAVSSGTGFVVAPSRILTNHHVARECSEMRVRTSTGTELTARVGATDEQRDLALLTVQGGDPGPVLAFRSGPEVRRGEGSLPTASRWPACSPRARR